VTAPTLYALTRHRARSLRDGELLADIGRTLVALSTVAFARVRPEDDRAVFWTTRADALTDEALDRGLAPAFPIPTNT
jgi:hypothetical protein